MQGDIIFEGTHERLVVLLTLTSASLTCEAMKVERRVSRDRAFQLSADDLIGLDKLLRNHGVECDCKLETSDGSTLTFANVDLATKFSNPTQRAVRRVKLRQRTLSRDFWISLDDERSGNFEYGIEADDDQAVSMLTQELDSWIAEHRPWWAIVAEWRGGWSALISYGLGMFAGPAGLDLVSWSTVPTLCFCLGLAFLLWRQTWRLSDKRHPTLFPLGAFNFGYGQRRSERLSAARSLVLVGIGLAIATNLIASEIFERKSIAKNDTNSTVHQSP